MTRPKNVTKRDQEKSKQLYTESSEKVLEMDQQTKPRTGIDQVLVQETFYKYNCKKCDYGSIDFEEYAKHVKKTKHIGCVLKVISEENGVTVLK